MSTELGATGAVEVKMGRGGSDSARLSAAAAFAATAARSRQHRDGAQACTDFHLARCQRYAFLTLPAPKYNYRDDVS